MSETTLPVVQDYTSLSAAARCGRYYFHAYEEGLVPKGQRVPLMAGSIMHEALRHLYGVAWDVEEAVEVLREAYDASGLTVPRFCSCDGRGCKCYAYMTPGHLEVALRNYVAAREENPTWIEESDGERAFLEEAVSWSWTNEQGEALLMGGKIDLPTQIAGKRVVVDHKTTTSWINSWWFNQRFGLGIQFRVYAAALQALHGERYEEAWVNAIYIGEKANDPPEAWANRQSVPHTLKKVTDITPASLEEAWQWAAGWQETVERWRSTGRWPQNEMACGDYGGCEFLPLCSVAPGKRREIEKRKHYEVRELTGILKSGADSE